MEKTPVRVPSTSRWEALETTPAATAPRVLKGRSVYTTKTTNRKKGSWGRRRRGSGRGSGLAPPPTTPPG